MGDPKTLYRETDAAGFPHNVERVELLGDGSYRPIDAEAWRAARFTEITALQDEGIRRVYVRVFTD